LPPSSFFFPTEAPVVSLPRNVSPLCVLPICFFSYLCVLCRRLLFPPPFFFLPYSTTPPFFRPIFFGLRALGFSAIVRHLIRRWDPFFFFPPSPLPPCDLNCPPFGQRLFFDLLLPSRWGNHSSVRDSSHKKSVFSAGSFSLRSPPSSHFPLRGSPSAQGSWPLLITRFLNFFFFQKTRAP